MSLIEKFKELAAGAGALANKLAAWVGHAHATGYGSELPPGVDGALALIARHVDDGFAALEQKFKDELAAARASFATKLTAEPQKAAPGTAGADPAALAAGHAAAEPTLPAAPVADPAHEAPVAG